MIHQILDLGTILIRQAIASGIRNVDHRGTCLDDSLNHASQILIVCTTCILGVELHILYVLLGILDGSHGTLDDFLAGRVELIFDVAIAGTDASMDSLVLGILQCLGSAINILLHCTSQRTDGWPCNRLGNLHHRIEVARAWNREARLNDINAQLLQRLSHLNLLNRVQLTSWNLLAIAKGCVENK